MRTAISRRGVIAALASGAAVNVPVIAMTAAAAAVEPPDALDALWSRRIALVAQSHALAAQMAVAVASMPEWARPGRPVSTEKVSHVGRRSRSRAGYRRLASPFARRP